MRRPTQRTPLLLCLLLALAAAPAAGQEAEPTSPEAFFGHPIGADHVLPDYTEFAAYWRRLADESARMRVVEIGRTTEGRPQLMAIVSSPENLARLDRWRSISERLTRAEGVDSAEARRLAEEGRAIVWIDGGLHATEVLGPQQLLETTWQLVSRDDPETRRILRDVVVLLVHANPDGMELVSDWYMRRAEPTERSTSDVPRLYQLYVGHDNNRDFFASTQVETENLNRQLFRTWYPQVVYDHHQTGPAGTVMFAPPFRDPFNYAIDPIVLSTIDALGAAMHTRFAVEGKRGVTSREGAGYSTWWNGGLRTITYFHNMTGLLTETIGNPTPERIPFLADRQLPSGDLVMPVAPQVWPFRRSVDYSVTANYAVLDHASRNRAPLLMNAWRMGRRAIERGRTDTWTARPRRLERVRAAMRADSAGSRPDSAASARYAAMLRDPAERDPRAWILPADQPDVPTAAELVNALLENGVEVHRATRAFRVGGRRVPAGSWVVRADQAFRAHVVDTFEPQDHPDDFRYPGGPPIPPYDNAGWTLAMQMGVEYRRVLEGLPENAPLERIDAWNVAPPPGEVTGSRRAAGWTFGPGANAAFRAANRLLEAGEPVFRLTEAWEGRPAGAFYVPAGSGTRARVETIAREEGIDFAGARRDPTAAVRLRRPRVALWDRYGGSMPSGWTRWLLERWRYPFELAFPQRLDAGSLARDFDALILPDGAVPVDSGVPEWPSMPDSAEVPAEWHPRLGHVTAEATVPRIRDFLEAGGTVVAVGSSAEALAKHLGLPLEPHVARRTEDGRIVPVPQEEYFVPGSILRADVVEGSPVAWGMPDHANVSFNRSPVFRLAEGAEGVRPLLRFDTPTPLLSGWAWGEERLEGGVAAVEARVGRGTLYLFGPLITRRAQPHGTFKLLFNALSNAAAEGEVR